MSLFSRERIDVECDVDIEQTQESFHAHAVPDGIDIRPGDEVLAYGLPSHIPFGEVRRGRCRATVIRAGALARWWTGVLAFTELTELYEVGFSADIFRLQPAANDQSGLARGETP